MLAAVNGALALLCDPENWEQFGTMTPETAAELMNEVLASYLASECVAEETVPTPYYTDGVNVDDSVSPEVQEWYGFFTNFDESWDDMNFVEQAGQWLFSGMIALAYSPGAAIVYRTTVSKFLLAVRHSDFGGAVRIMIDGYDVATLDTSENPDSIVNIPVVGDPDLTEHELRIINVTAE